MFNRRKNRQLDRQAKTINDLRHDLMRVRDLLDKNGEDFRQALERIHATSPEHDWKAEASGLAYMICSIHDRYIFAKEALGGDSEFLASAITNAEKWVNGPMLEYFSVPEHNDGRVSPDPDQT